MNNTIASSIMDILSLFEIPTTTLKVPTTTLMTLWNIHQEKKAAQARDILFSEIKRGDFKNIGDDDKISIVHRYLLSASNGAARLNLRILAQLIHGLLNDKNLQPALYASEFNRYTKILEDLSYQEIQMLATLYKFEQQNTHESQMGGFQQAVSAHIPDPSHYYDKARRWLAGEKVCFKMGVGLVEEKNRSKILDAGEFNAMSCALTRTGLVFLANAETLSPKVRYYELSPLFFKIIKLTDFQEALRKEKSEKTNNNL